MSFTVYEIWNTKILVNVRNKTDAQNDKIRSNSTQHHWMAPKYDKLHCKYQTKLQIRHKPQIVCLQALLVLYWLIFTMHFTDSLQHIFIKTELSFMNDLHEETVLEVCKFLERVPFQVFDPRWRRQILHTCCWFWHDRKVIGQHNIHSSLLFLFFKLNW